MSIVEPPGATIPGVSHHVVDINAIQLHYVSSGTSGSPILLLHGWPETWWAFRKVIPILSGTHRVIAADLRGFGDSSNADGEYTDIASADDLHHLVGHLGLGAVHVVCQDISGGVGFRFAATNADDVLSFTGIETTFPGFGLEALSDVNNGGSWHNGFLGAPGIPEMLLPGHEREFIQDWAFPMMTRVEGAVLDEDFDEFLRTYTRPNAWRGTTGLYQSIFSDDGRTKALAQSNPLAIPVLSVESFSAPITENTLRQVTAGDIHAVRLEGVGHLIAQEAPQEFSDALLEFVDRVDQGQ